MDSTSRSMKFYILALHTIQLLASTPFGLCEYADRARITPGLGLYKTLRVLQQIESPSPENSFPYGTFTSPPPLLGAMPPNPVNSPPTPTRAVPPPFLSTSPPPPPAPSAQSPLNNAPKTPAVIIPPPNSHSSPPPPLAIIPPPNGQSSPQKPPPAPFNKPDNALWCVVKSTVPADLIQQALDYACGSGAACDAIQPNGVCYQPATLISHASYAFNSYWQKNKQGGGTCDFGGAAMLVTVDPSNDQCRFMSD